MIKKCGSFVALATIAFIALPAIAATTSKDVDITVTHASGDCSNGPKVVTDKSNYRPGETITVSTICGAGNAADWVYVTTYYTGAWGPSYQSYLGVSAVNATVKLPVPNAVSDRDLQYVIRWNANDSFTQITSSAPFTVSKTISPPTPTATLPASLAADPFVPAHVITVCASGCDYKDLGGAINASANNNWDNIQIKISSGEYEYPTATLSDNYPLHLWIKGISADGVTRPHIFGFTPTSAAMIGSKNFHWTNEGGSLTVDNMEFGPWSYWGLVPHDGTTWTLRNVYIRDSEEGLISGNVADMTLNIYNSVLSRSGGPSGPEHDIYVGEGGGRNTLNVINSVFEQPVIGHAFKERARFGTISCSMFLVNQDDFYLGSQTIDIDSGQPTFTNILSVNAGGSTQQYTSSQSWANGKIAVDYEAQLVPIMPAINSSIFIADQPNSAHWFFALGERMGPMTWSHNTFVWPDADSRFPGPGGGPTDVSDPTGVFNTQHNGNTNDVTLDGTNKYFNSRAAAGLPPVGTYPKGWRDYLPLMPAACTDPIGLVKIPAN